MVPSVTGGRFDEIRHDGRHRGVSPPQGSDGGHVGRSPGRDEREIPFFDAGAPALDSHTYDESSAPGRQPGRGRGVGAAMAVMALLATGIMVGGILEPPAPTESPSPTGPNASAPAPAPACVPVATSAVPAVTLRAVGTQVGFGGVAGYTHRPGAETPSEGWQVPVADPGRGVPEIASGIVLEAVGPPGTCFRYVISEFADATLGHVPRQAERRPLLSALVEPPSPNPGLGTLPDGDWVVRMTAYFETGVHGPEGSVIAEFYFRVRVGSGPLPTPTPEPTPAVTPAVACGPAPATPDDVELVITAPGSEGVAGVPDGTAAPTLSIPVGEFAELSVGGDACARSWVISAVRPGTGERIYADSLINRNDDPGFISQNRWRIRPEVGSYDLVASLRFGPGLDVVRVWRIVGGGFTVPDTFLTAANGSWVRALPGCGLSFTLASGYSAAEPCNGGFQEPAGVVRDELPLLRAPAWSRVALEIPGWTITSWYGACGQIEADPSGIEFFNAPGGCTLGSYSVSDTETPPAPAQFLVRPGELVMELRVHATGSAGVYDVKLYVRVAGR
jgi:hypothetical protein